MTTTTTTTTTTTSEPASARLAAGGGPPADHPALHVLRRCAADELEPGPAAAVRAHLDGCSACASLLAAERTEAEEFLRRRPYADLQRALRERACGTAAGPARPEGEQARPSLWRWLVSPFGAGLGFAAAAAGVAAVVWFGAVGLPPGVGPHADAGLRGTRLKVPCGLGFSVLREGQAHRGADGERCRAGERIRVTYSRPRDGYLIIVSLDSSGAVTPFYDDDGRSLRSAAGVERALEGAIELDAAAGPERVLGCFSDQPLETSVVVAAAERALATAGGDPRSVRRLELPCDQAGFVIIKE